MLPRLEGLTALGIRPGNRMPVSLADAFEAKIIYRDRGETI
jgi:hypothetical protein